MQRETTRNEGSERCIQTEERIKKIPPWIQAKEKKREKLEGH